MNKRSRRLYDTTMLFLAVVMGVFLLRNDTIPIFYEQKIVALTYDDGPSTISTKKLLDLLDKYDATATFLSMEIMQMIKKT